MTTDNARARFNLIEQNFLVLFFCRPVTEMDSAAADCRFLKRHVESERSFSQTIRNNVFSVCVFAFTISYFRILFCNLLKFI